MKPQNFEERLVWYFIVGTYVLYFLTLQYPLNSLLAWFLFFYLGKKLWSQSTNTVKTKEEEISIPWVTGIWIISMIVMAICTIVAYENLGMDLKEIVKGLIHWGISWALLALFPLAGCLNIRPQLIYRAICILCLQSLIFIVVCYAAYILRIPGELYTSSAEKLLQNGPIYYKVLFYSFSEDSHEMRLYLFTPWAPALGFVATLYFFIVLQEPNKKWRWIGIVGSIAMNLTSGSRLALISIPIVYFAVFIASNLNKILHPIMQIASGFILFLGGLFGAIILKAFKDFTDAFKGARADSTKVRAALAEIAFERWKDAPIWGHGNQAPGPPVVAKMPIGSHHTWMGLLFVKGIVGFLAMIVPMGCSLIDLLIKVQTNKTAQLGLSIWLTLLLFSFGENLEILAYIGWPALVVLGMAFRAEDPDFIYLERDYEATSA